MVEPGVAEILVVVEFSLTKACVMTVDLTRKNNPVDLTRKNNPASKSTPYSPPYFCTVYVILKGEKISPMRHARGEKRGVNRDRSMSSSVGTSTIPPPKKARKIKDWPRVQKHLKLHRKVFKECEHNRPLSSAESAMLGLKSKRRSSRLCAKRRSGLGTMPESRRATTESYRTATVLSVLLAEDKITLYQAVEAVEKFDDDYDIHIRWLKMSRENKIKYVQDLR